MNYYYYFESDYFSMSESRLPDWNDGRLHAAVAEGSFVVFLPPRFFFARPLHVFLLLFTVIVGSVNLTSLRFTEVQY